MEDKKEKLPMPEREITVNIGGNIYTIKLPTTGQEIDIESLKDQMTNGSHKNMLYGDTFATDAWTATSAIASFRVLLPQLQKDLNVQSLSELDRIRFKSVRKAYFVYYEWIQKWRKYIEQDEEEVSKDE